MLTGSTKTRKYPTVLSYNYNPHSSRVFIFLYLLVAIDVGEKPHFLFKIETFIAE